MSVLSLSLSKRLLQQASELARQCSTDSIRERVLISQTVMFALKEYLFQATGVVSEEGRSGSIKYLELLDICDFKAANWQIEVRTITTANKLALYVPTMPIMVGVLSDYYVCAHVDSTLRHAELLGYTSRKALDSADLSKNGLFAILPIEELKPIETLPGILKVVRPSNPRQSSIFHEWQSRAERVMRGVREVLAVEDELIPEQVSRLAASLRDEILRIYGEHLPETGIESLFDSLFERFGVERPVPAAPDSLITFKQTAKDQSDFSKPATRDKFFRDTLSVRQRIALYRYLLEDEGALQEHRKMKSIVDRVTEGKRLASPRRTMRTSATRKARTELIWMEPPIRQPEEIALEKTDGQKIAQSVQQGDRLKGDAEGDIAMLIQQLKPNTVVQGTIFPEPVQVILTIPMGDSVKLVGKGLNTGRVHEPVLNAAQLATLIISPQEEMFDGDPHRFRLGVEALRLGLAYEYDPYFSLSIARVDPLPHQLEAVYDYFMKLPRIRFLLADDPGAGKTIMAGLLLKELKIRGLAKRTLIVTPANLSFQWQRELKDKFRENFEVVRGDVLRANYGSNPWQEKNQVITSVSWVSVVDDARESLLRSHWDLIIVDEAHKMSAYSRDKKTLAYQLGEHLSKMTDHYLLMTATPHKGDPKNFCLFLELLDRDVYGDVKSLEEAMKRNAAPFYLRRTKEALVTFPDPETGQVKKIFTKRNVETIGFQIDAEERDFYDDLSDYVEDQSIKASVDDSARGRALAFTMAMLQRRFASSIYAVRRSLQRMRDKRQHILDDPAGYRQEQIAKRVPEDFDELPENEQQSIINSLEDIVASVDPVALKIEIQQLDNLIDQAMALEMREIESKLVKLKDEIVKQGVFEDPNMKLLIFTEHKDTLDYLVGKLKSWGLSVTQIHGSMKVGDRDTPGSRIYAEREFRETCQVLVATEAAGEGINLQFCWFMINYDIPWNPVRLEQRMGRIHRYGQEKDCLIFNFVSVNTREGRVLHKLLERLKEIRMELGTDQVFDVVGEVFPSNLLEKMFRDMYAHNLTEEAIKNRIVEEVDTERFRKITGSTLEGLAKRDLNLSSLVGKSTEARERRLVPEVIEDFFIKAGPLASIYPKETKNGTHIYRLGRVPRTLWQISDQLEPKFGKMGREYKQIVFDKELLTRDSTSEWITPGHPLFEVVREDVTRQVRDDLQRGSIFYDLNTAHPYRLDIFTAAIRDGRGNRLHQRIFVVQVEMDGSTSIKQPTIFLDLSLATNGVPVPAETGLPDRNITEQALIEKALNPFLEEVAAERVRETETILQHLEISLNELIHRQNLMFAELMEQQQQGDASPLLAANLKKTEDRLDELNNRLENRQKELEQERQCTIGDIQFIGRAWVLPHPERNSPDIAPMVRDEEIEKIAVASVIEYETARGWVVESVESENRGFDLISRKPHSEDPQTSIDVRFIEVKGRSEIGEVALSTNEYRTAERLKSDYWLYVVYDCSSKPEVYPVQNPARLGWQPIIKIEHFQVGAKQILDAAK